MRFRPHFFAGVATVVAKLLIQCEPDIAMFGEKDYQQLKVVTRMARDLDLQDAHRRRADRARDATASRCRRATPTCRRPNARPRPTLHRVLKDCAAAIAAGQPIAAALDRRPRARSRRPGFALDYLEARNAETLAPRHSAKDGPIRLLVAARIGKTRLIDNVACSCPM